MVNHIGEESPEVKDGLRKAQRELQIVTLIQEQFNELAPTEEEIATVEKELWNNPAGLAQEWLCLTNTSRNSVNMLYMSIAVSNLRLKKQRQNRDTIQ